jgi:transposase
MLPPPPAAEVPVLPDDPAVLKGMIVELLASLHDAQRDNAQLRQRLDALLRRLYGPRAERLDANQLLLFAQAVASPAPPPALPAAPPSAAPHGHGRRRLPASLPRRRIEHDLPVAERRCPQCGHQRQRIGQEVSEQLDYQPAALFVVEHVRPTYACHHCQGQVTTAAKPAQPIDKGLPGPGLLAQVITSKYGDHLPLYRLERIFSRHGLELKRSTTCDWMAACADLLQPLYVRMVQAVLASAVVHTDDTPLPVQDRDRDRARQGRLWVYLGDRDHPYNVFAYTPSRARDGPQQFLKRYRGYLQADAFGGYDGIYAAGNVVEVACWAHARRKFYEARTSDAERSHAALAWIGRLYEIEKRAKELSVTARQALRQMESVPILTALCQWLREQGTAVLPKSPFGQAVTYALNNWKALVRYTEAGILAIDNNAAEREMKRIAIGRKNWLFTGSDRGGATAAVLFSITSSCQRHGLDPFAYLRDVLARLPDQSPERREELLPDRWATAQKTAPA